MTNYENWLYKISMHTTISDLADAAAKAGGILVDTGTISASYYADRAKYYWKDVLFWFY